MSDWYQMAVTLLATSKYKNLTFFLGRIPKRTSSENSLTGLLSTNNYCIHIVHIRGKPAGCARTVVSSAAMATKTIQIVAVQPRLAGRLASNGAQGLQLPIGQTFLMTMLTVSVLFEIRAATQKIETVAEFAAQQPKVLLLRIAERRIHALA
jgi:hypothetical protein